MWLFQYRDSTVRTIRMVLNTKNIVLEGTNLHQFILLSTLIIRLQFLGLYFVSTQPYPLSSTFWVLILSTQNFKYERRQISLDSVHKPFFH